MKNMNTIKGYYIRVRDNEGHEAGYAVVEDGTNRIYMDSDFKNYMQGTELSIDKDGNIDAEKTEQLAKEHLARKQKAEKEYQEKMLKKLDVIKPYIGKEIYSKKSDKKGVVTDEYRISGSAELPGGVTATIKYEDGSKANWDLQSIINHFE